MSEAAATGRLRAGGIASGAIVAAYVLLGLLLVLTRVVGLDRSLWLDEIMTVEDYVRRGPIDILSGSYELNNHELFSLLAWATSEVVGESEAALRLWSVLPFLAGVALVTAWLHRRVAHLAGVFFLFLCTGSPLLLDITPQARGYGLAFCAMSVVVVAALESDRSSADGWWLVAFFAGGVVGSLTLPHFAVPFLATGVVLLWNTRLRRRVAVGLPAVGLVVAAWYAPHVDDLLEGSRQVYGVQIGLFGVVTAPIDQILLPALLWFDGVVLVAGLVWLPIVAWALVVVGSSPLLAHSRTVAILLSGVLVTILVLWIARVHVVPRFLSFLLVPLFMLAASGAADVLTRPPRRLRIRGVLTVVGLAALALRFFTPTLDVMSLPREANKDAAMLIRSEAAADAEIYPHMVHPRTLAFYLERPLERRPTQRDVPSMCARPVPVVLVVQPWVLRPLEVPCLGRPGVEQHRFEQYTRGGEIAVWFVPPVE